MRKISLIILTAFFLLSNLLISDVKAEQMPSSTPEKSDMNNYETSQIFKDKYQSLFSKDSQKEDQINKGLLINEVLNNSGMNEITTERTCKCQHKHVQFRSFRHVQNHLSSFAK